MPHLSYSPSAKDRSCKELLLFLIIFIEDVIGHTMTIANPNTWDTGWKEVSPEFLPGTTNTVGKKGYSHEDKSKN